MLLSVVMAVYNIGSEPILSYAINSILQQTFTDFEFVICDDASTDNTYEILCKIAKTDKRICLLRNGHNMKAGGARNACLAVARGEYIAIMDADDVSHPERLEKQVSFLREHLEFDFVGSRGQFFCNNLEKVYGQYWFCKAPQKEDFLFTLPFVHASLLFRRSALERVHGYSEKIKAWRCEDYDMLMRMYIYGMKGSNLPEVLYYIRQDEDTYKRRKYYYRFNEAMIKYKAFKAMKLMPKGILYVIKPLIVGLMPVSLLQKLQKGYYKDK